MPQKILADNRCHISLCSNVASLWQKSGWFLRLPNQTELYLFLLIHYFTPQLKLAPTCFSAHPPAVAFPWPWSSTVPFSSLNWRNSLQRLHHHHHHCHHHHHHHIRPPKHRTQSTKFVVLMILDLSNILFHHQSPPSPYWKPQWNGGNSWSQRLTKAEKGRSSPWMVGVEGGTFHFLCLKEQTWLKIFGRN